MTGFLRVVSSDMVINSQELIDGLKKGQGSYLNNGIIFSCHM